MKRLMRGFLLLCASLMSASLASGAERLNGAQIEALLNNTTAWYTPLAAASARQYFNKNGSTDYIDSNGVNSFGTWRMRDNKYCSQWPPSEHWVCYGLEKGKLADGTLTITFISGGNGKRYEAVYKSGRHLDEVWGQ